MRSDNNRTRFVCPRDQAELDRNSDCFHCRACDSRYPVVQNIPVFIVDEFSVFSRNDYVSGNAYAGNSYRLTPETGRVRRLVRQLGKRLAQSPTKVASFHAYDAIAHAASMRANPKILVLGSGGTDYNSSGHEVIYTDVAFGPNVDAIADAHNLPFPTGGFDLVISVAVLEHVADPQRCTTEIHRVLAPGGFVYAVTPFLQPVHMGAYDFTRFTPLGHRRLFRFFDTLKWGLAMGPSSTLAYSISAFFESCSRGHRARRFAKLAGLLCTPPLRKIDPLLARSPSAWDSAAATFFFGQKRLRPVPDREIISEYRGGFRHPGA